MKRNFQAVLLVFAMIAAVPAAAAELDLFGSYMTTDDFDDSWGVGVRTGWTFGGGPIGMELRASYFPELGEDIGTLIDEVGTGFFDRQDLSAIPLDAGLTFMIGRNVHVGAGFTYIILDADFADLDDETGFYGSLGFRTAGRTGIGFFAEGIYRSIEGSIDPSTIRGIGDIDISDDVPFDLSGLTVNAGITFRW
jgi:hypothetical protein